MALVGKGHREVLGCRAPHHTHLGQHAGRRGIVDGDVAVVVAKTECGRESWRDVERRLMVEAEIVDGGTEQSGNRLQVGADPYPTRLGDGCLSCGHGLLLRESALHHLLGHGVDHSIVHGCLDVAAEELVHFILHVHGSVGLQPLCGEEATKGPMPKARTVALERQLLGEGILELTLFHIHVVGRHIVDVHPHVVLEVLVGGDGIEVEPIATEANVESRVDDIAAVEALMVGSR